MGKRTKRLSTMALVGTALLLGILLVTDVTMAGKAPLWLRYPAISPDGSTIAFSYQGDLYRVPAAGGRAVLLTLHEAYDCQPVWSPDGKTIAFASNRFGQFDVYFMPAQGGEPRRLTFHSAGDYPSDFTPDGRAVIFSSLRLDAVTSVQFPSWGMSELYQISVKGGRPLQILSTCALSARFDEAGNRLLYEDLKGYENPWRKHHQSSVARDIWMVDLPSGDHTRITTFAGEDRNPIWVAGEEAFFYLSEESGSFNVWKASLDSPLRPEPLTRHTAHPVRYLSCSDNGILCYTYDGEIYLRRPGAAQSEKVLIEIAADRRLNAAEHTTAPGKATEMAVSPTGKEIALVVRGEVFVTSVDHEDTKRITDTPEQERWISFSPDGRSLLYAGERDGSWNVYRTSLVHDDEHYFFSSTSLREEPMVATPLEEFQPRYSPDGKEIAYLEERTTLKVLNLDTDQTRLVLPADMNYSYSDGDQWYEWSPDGRWFLVTFNDPDRWSDEVGLIDAAGKEEVVNLTKNGYEDIRPHWMSDGAMMIWLSPRYGLRRHVAWGGEADVMGLFFTQEAFDRYRLSEAELEILKEEEKLQEKDDKEGEEKADEKKEEGKDKKKRLFEPKELPDPIRLELEDLEDRTRRLSLHSARIRDAVVTPDGEQLLYLARFEKGYDLWSYQHRKSEIKRLTKLEAKRAGSMKLSDDAKTLYLLADGTPIKIEVDKGDKENISFSAKMDLRRDAEREYIFEHVWRQTLKKFYAVDMHGVDWSFCRDAYARFLPHVNNNFDFSVLLSEMVGELNASHTGCYYWPTREGRDETASLGAFYDPDYYGVGLKLTEIIDKSPLRQAGSKITAGTIIEKIDGETIEPNGNFFPLLNHKAGKKVRLSLYDPGKQERWDETVKPISRSQEHELLYQRWVKSRREETDRLSDGRIGYAHVRGMNDRSYREVFAEVMGRGSGKDAIIIDTRFNGGGNLTENLTTLLSGERYARAMPRGRILGESPWERWNRPSIVIMSESNYSDAHYFPYAYRQLGIGKLVGMPVPGTATSVWWERQLDPSLSYGIPEIGILAENEKLLENQQLDPDYLVDNEPEVVVKGRDQMLEKAVEVLLDKLDGR